MTRIGHGYDVHKLVEGRKLILGGVEIPHTVGLLGHSDADVLTHALMDALLGALALGDIGHLFPDNEPAYEGADSIRLLRYVNALIEQSLACIHSLEAAVESMPDTEESAQSSAMIFRDAVREKMEDLRQHIDALERIVGKDYWPQPSYGEMLFRIN